MKTFYIVTGRIPYDDEDSLYVFEAKNIEEADAKFREKILEDGEPTEFDEDGAPSVYVMTYVKVKAETAPIVEWSND